jgi:hypothetical protein
VNIIAAISNMGDFFYTINFGMTNTEKFWYFLLKLITHLSSQDIHWRNNTIFMIDNARYHRSKAAMGNYKRFRIPIMLLGPYQFGMAPIEMMFSFIKQ